MKAEHVGASEMIATKPAGDTTRFVFFRSVEAAGADWDAACPPDNLFLSRAYLSVLESNPPLGMRFGYLVFYRGEQPAGVALCQIKHFDANGSIQDRDESSKDPCFFTVLVNWFRKWLKTRVSGELLICGNMLLSGEHGYWFDPEKIGAREGVALLEAAWQGVIKQLEREGLKVPVILVKDIAPEHRQDGRQLERSGFTEFEIQPSMVMPMQFENFEDYLAAMTTKYRTRAKRAFKKANGIERKELSLADIQREMPRIFALYHEIARNAGFNMVDLNQDYLLALKRELPGHYRLFAYYLNGELVAFFTTINNNGHTLEAHFLGYEKDLNHDYQLYLNILYDIVRIGFEDGVSSIVFARTALEIKSSVGAVPHDLYNYLRHQNPLANKLTNQLIDYIKPIEEWQPRHPFREEVGGGS